MVADQAAFSHGHTGDRRSISGSTIIEQTHTATITVDGIPMSVHCTVRTLVTGAPRCHNPRRP